MQARQVKQALASLADPARARILQRFFKTAPGEYGAGDVFLGLTVGQQRQVARQFQDLPLAQLRSLLRSPLHEERLVALLIHKATGWMLREVGKRNRATLESFLDAHAPRMPRTMLRYAIERLPEPVRQRYLCRGR